VFLPITYELEITNDAGDPCEEDDWEVLIDNEDEVGSASKFPPTDTQTVTVTLSLLDFVEGEGDPVPNEDVNDCQGVTATITITIIVEQASDPHDTTD
jgi:hypothetical protein